MRNPPDLKAAEIDFGVELETAIPANSMIDVGSYHIGSPVSFGVRQDGRRSAAPLYNGIFYWRADNDGSIRFSPVEKGCEFVSPILRGDEGISNLLAFVRFAKQIGATVNGTCGCHITIGVPSVIGSSDARQVALFIRKLARVVHKHAWAVYAQTGTNRHQSTYSRPLLANAWEVTNELKKTVATRTTAERYYELEKLGRGIVNFKKALPSDLSKSCIEFRAFAGTLNQDKILHHLATALGLCRRAATTKLVPAFSRPDAKPPRNALMAMRRLWEYLGWQEDHAGADVAFGQFGTMHVMFDGYKMKALAMAERFEMKHPFAFAGKDRPVPAPAEARDDV